MPNLTSRHEYTAFPAFPAFPAHHRPRNQGAPRVPKELATYLGLTKGRFQRLLSTRSGPTPALVVRNRSEVASWLASIGEYSPDQESNHE